jgi:hypothetical protein
VSRLIFVEGFPGAGKFMTAQFWRPLRLSFSGGTSHEIDAFHCSGPRIWWAGPPGTFRRIASS